MATIAPGNKDWETILKLVDRLKNPKIREFTKGFLLEVVPDYFATIPASSTGKYHPAYSLGEGGLLRHTIAAAIVAKQIAKLEYWQFSPGDRELIFAAAILHDTFKQGVVASGHTERAHPNIAAQQIRKYAEKVNEPEIGKYLAGLVVAHMGEFGNQKPGNRGQFCVHLADFIASRKNIDIHWDDDVIAEL